MNIEKIVLGTTSVHKLNAAKRACKLLGMEAEVSGVKAASGQNEQPIGFEETYGGALARAKGAQAVDGSAVAVGIENGVFRFGGDDGKKHAVDFAVVVVLLPDGQESVATSLGMEYPDGCVVEAERRGFETTTIGSVFAERFGGDPTDSQSVISKGRAPRVSLLTDTIVQALTQISGSVA
jgi:non-canonical (house-cleaning) NTP pyrophosphatase